MSAQKNNSWESIQPTAPLLLVVLPEAVTVPKAAVKTKDVTFSNRAFAHMVDMTIIHGTSVYTAKGGALGFLALLQNMYGLKGSGNAVMLAQLFSYSYWSIWAASLGLGSLCYFVISTHKLGKTFGQAFFELKVVDANGQAPTFAVSLKRYFFGIVCYASGGIFFHLSLHDKWTDTKVVSTQK
jgi:uncharacterized RDD family membrane protein YckC